MDALLQAEGIYFGFSNIAIKNFQTLDFLQGILTAPVRSLKPLDGRPLAGEINLFGKSKIENTKIQVRDFLQLDLHGAHKEPYGSAWAPFGKRAEFI